MVELGPVNPSIQSVFTDLDSLFDTRFGILEQVDKRLALKILKKGWANRSSDVFEPIDPETWSELWRTRDAETLAISPQTLLVESIQRWFYEAKKIALASPLPMTLQLYVNTWPYRLDKRAARDIGEALMKIIKVPIKIVMLNRPLKDFCTRTAKNHFSAMFLYDYDDWLESNTESGSFEKVRIPDVTLYAPKLLKKGELPENQKRELAQSKVDLFTQFEIAAGPLVRLEFIDLAFFSHQLPTDFLDHFDFETNSIKSETA